MSKSETTWVVCMLKHIFFLWLQRDHESKSKIACRFFLALSCIDYLQVTNFLCNFLMLQVNHDRVLSPSSSP